MRCNRIQMLHACFSCVICVRCWIFQCGIIQVLNFVSFGIWAYSTNLLYFLLYFSVVLYWSIYCVYIISYMCIALFTCAVWNTFVNWCTIYKINLLLLLIQYMNSNKIRELLNAHVATNITLLQCEHLTWILLLTLQ